jgi:hypothetical protein
MEKIMKLFCLLILACLLSASPASAHWIVQIKPGKCEIVAKKPAAGTAKIVGGGGAHMTQRAAEAKVKTLHECMEH